jgi:hypothetical protein
MLIIYPANGGQPVVANRTAPYTVQEDPYTSLAMILNRSNVLPYVPADPAPQEEPVPEPNQ